MIAIIPARFDSTRLPGKLLLEIDGKPLILHTLDRANESRLVERIIVATDDRRIEAVVKSSGYEAAMTSTQHASGSDRVAEVAQDLPEGSIVVNVQGDEPLISPLTIDRAVAALIEDPAAEMATTYNSFSSLEDLEDPNNVKIVVSSDGRALYFSRSIVPYLRDDVSNIGDDLRHAIAAKPELINLFKKHEGLYVFRREYLLRFSKLPRTSLEKLEMLEQLRALEDGVSIRAVESAAESIGIDTSEDLERARAFIGKSGSKAIVA